MFVLNWRPLSLAAAVALAAATIAASSAEAGWGHRRAYRPVVAPVSVYRPAYSVYRPVTGYIAPRYVAPAVVYRPVTAYRPVVPLPVAPIGLTPYRAAYGAYPSYGAYPRYSGYRAGYGGYSPYRSGYGGYGVGVNLRIAPVGYIGY